MFEAPQLPKDWLNFLGEKSTNELLATPVHKLEEAYQQNQKIYPDLTNIFKAFELCKPEQVRVIVLGQDPYHGEGQAHGLCFSVPEGVRLPASLRNILKELASDIDHPGINSGNLEGWARQGVLLLNAVLSVEASKAASHVNFGWQAFTDYVIRQISQKCTTKVFMLWGNYAQKKAPLIDQKKHLILTAAHPSPLSAYRGFFGCKHFSKANDYLIRNSEAPITW